MEAAAEARRQERELRRLQRVVEEGSWGAAKKWTAAIFDGEHVDDRSDIGRHTHACPHCSAILYPSEKSWTMMCCRENKTFALNAEARPSAEHARRYKKPEGTEEVSVLIDYEEMAR